MPGEGGQMFRHTVRDVDPLYTARRPQIGRIRRKTRIACNPEPSAIASLTRFGSAAWGIPKLNVASSSPVTRYCFCGQCI